MLSVNIPHQNLCYTVIIDRLQTGQTHVQTIDLQELMEVLKTPYYLIMLH